MSSLLIIVTILAIILIVRGVKSINTSSEDKLSSPYKHRTIDENYFPPFSYFSSDAPAKEQLDDLIIHNPSLQLNDGEVCFYEGTGKHIEEKEKLAGYRKQGKNTRIKWTSYWTTNYNLSEAEAIRKTSQKSYRGHLYITNKRIVFLCEKNGFDVNFKDIQNITHYTDCIEIYHKNKFHRVFTNQSRRIYDIQVLMNRYANKQKNTQSEASTKNKEYYKSETHQETYANTVRPETKATKKTPTEAKTAKQKEPVQNPTPENITPNPNYKSNSITDFWNSKDKSEWRRALNNYYYALSQEEFSLDEEMDYLIAEDVKNYSVEEFYNFLHDKYFVWKYTAKNRLATTRKSLEKYISENKLHELQEIKDSIFTLDRNNIELCLSNATKIKGLGPAGASGLLAILFPRDFGTIDQFVAISMQKIQNIENRQRVLSIKPESLSISDGVVIITILRDKAKELNSIFQTNEWTPRKIDMILWAIDRDR